MKILRICSRLVSGWSARILAVYGIGAICGTSANAETNLGVAMKICADYGFGSSRQVDDFELYYDDLQWDEPLKTPCEKIRTAFLSKLRAEADRLFKQWEEDEKKKMDKDLPLIQRGIDDPAGSPR